MARLVHGICTFYGQWLPGDARGFRSRDHRVHSSGDYKSPPPPEEHNRLLRHVQSSMMQLPVLLDPSQRQIVALAFAHKLISMRGVVHVLSCGATHLHVLYESFATDALAELGRAKQFSSHRLALGRIWAGGGKVIAVSSADHAQNAREYIIDHAR